MFDLFGKKKKAELEEEIKYALMLALNCELEKIKKWNEETFPDATLGGQLEKLEEEFEEYCSAYYSADDVKKELADIFIVLGGLRRWKSKTGCYIENVMTIQMPFEVLTDLLLNISEKMEINRKRVWKKSGNGKFHHKEGTK